ncbi:MAG: hypothetical protein FJ202_00755 [Gemmatimonadetes bacterium]|nr:hypothetical protein [Gemmatimonadota bacterium]
MSVRPFSRDMSRGSAGSAGSVSRIVGAALGCAIGSALGAVFVSSCATAQSGTAGSRSGTERPALVVMLTIDQLRADYLDRFGSQFTGGLRRIATEGALFKNGFHDHGITETAPGHAAVLSGRFPVRTGIVMNSQGVNNVANAQVIGANEGVSASPERFRGTTLLDWMRAANPATKWLSVSRKDRGAILPIGKSKGDVYWYLPTGEFTTSGYYADTLPTWVRQFNARRIPHSYAGKTWDLFRDASAYPEPDTVSLEANAAGGDITFPHAAPRDPAQMAASFAAFPWMDELTLQFALHGVRSLGLGADAGRSDLLAISLSTTDAIGHRFGPDSRELHDQILRLDAALGAFLDSLTALRGPGRVVLALSSDHGVAPFPTIRSPNSPNADAKRVSLDLPWKAFLQRLAAARVDTNAVALDDGLVILRMEAFSRVRGGADALLESFARDVRRLQGVQRVDLMTDLAKADTTRDVIARRWLHMFAPTSNVRLIVTLTPYSYWLSTTYASHGSPHDYDAQVPVAFWGRGVSGGVRADSVRVVDIAPTLAAILAVRPTEPVLDGRVLRQAIQP